MIYEEEIIITGKVPRLKIQPVEVWDEVAGFMQHRGFIGSSYKLGLGMKKNGPADLGHTKTLHTDSVAKELRLDEGEAILDAWLPKPNGIGDIHHLNFHTKHGFLNLSGRVESFPNEWDSFFMTSNLGEKLVNVLIRPRSYIRSLKVYKTPPENDLLKAPGLTNDRGDYLEGVAAEMWFGESFWQYASCTKEDLKSCDWLKCDDRNFQLHVEAWDGPFTSEEGKQGELQRELLKMLFGIGK